MAEGKSASAILKRRLEEKDEAKEEIEQPPEKKKTPPLNLFSFNESKNLLVFTPKNGKAVSIGCADLMKWLFKELTAINKQLEKSQTELSVPKATSMRDLMQNKLPVAEFEIKDAASAYDFVRQFRNSMVPAQYRLKFSFGTATQGKKESVVSITIAMFHSAVDIHVEPLKGSETVTSKGSYVKLLEGLQDLYRTWEDFFENQTRQDVEAQASRDLMKLLKSKQVEFVESWLPENVELFIRVLAVLIVAEPIRCNVNLPLGVMALHLIKHQVKTSDTLFKENGFWPAAHGGSKNEFILIEDHLENGTPLSATAQSTLEMMHSVLGVYLASALNTTQKTLYLGELTKPEQLMLLCQETLKRKVLNHIKTRASDKNVLGADLNNAVKVPT